MEKFEFANQVKIGISEALLLLYRYLTDIYALGDLSFVQFLSGYMWKKRSWTNGCRILTVSGNGIGELERMLFYQWKLERLETMSVTSAQMRLMRMMMESSPEEIERFFNWARRSLEKHPNIRTLLDAPGLIGYWRNQCETWRSPELKGRLHLFGGSPWHLPDTDMYDAIVMSHTQNLLLQRDAKELLKFVKPGGMLALVVPVIFRPKSYPEARPSRFSDHPSVKAAKQSLEAEATRLGYSVRIQVDHHIRWDFGQEDVGHYVSFSLASPLRSLLIGELLIQSLCFDIPEHLRLDLLETVISTTPPAAGAGMESLLILLTEKPNP